MERPMKLKSVILGIGLAAASAVAVAADTWKLAVTDVEGMERLQLEWGPFKDALEAATGDTFQFYAVNSRTAAAEALRGETVDFVVSGPAEYVVINKLTNATPLIGLGRPDYHCAIIVRADSGINVPADLKGKKVAFGDIGSTSNMLCPMQVLADHGLDPVNDIEKTHTSRNIAHEALKAGDVDAIGSNAGSWLNVRNKEPDLPYGFFKMIARSGDLPNDMIMVGAHVPSEAADLVKNAILENKHEVIAGITAHEENDKYVGMDLVSIDDSAYDYVRSMYSNAGFPQFDTFIGD
ncbi:PhnD/SsuA/transferrin family substrate-binding protein [Roseobacter sp. YSTF-M11]|uniref:PhnD/SsuA/transferrin family substrate-binding protein n=2 Tax=Roseobacter insulae TaxID=2859783 RepID=A0A9X1FS47_9RHOB|nr:PhnD/SsuA/transferrin family substrate-binding protein [Roseobacter insulae]